MQDNDLQLVPVNEAPFQDIEMQDVANYDNVSIQLLHIQFHAIHTFDISF